MVAFCSYTVTKFTKSLISHLPKVIMLSVIREKKADRYVLVDFFPKPLHTVNQVLQIFIWFD